MLMVLCVVALVISLMPLLRNHPMQMSNNSSDSTGASIAGNTQNPLPPFNPQGGDTCLMVNAAVAFGDFLTGMSSHSAIFINEEASRTYIRMVAGRVYVAQIYKPGSGTYWGYAEFESAQFQSGLLAAESDSIPMKIDMMMNEELPSVSVFNYETVVSEAEIQQKMNWDLTCR
jgi:hypothetical protein